MVAGILLGLGASACWALANVAVQRASRAVGTIRGLLWSQLAIVVAIAVLAAVGAGAHPAAGIRVPAGGISAALWGWVAVSGVAGLLAYLCLFYAFEHGRLTLAVPIMSSWAVLAAGLSLAMFGERLHAAQLVGAVAVIAGAVTVSRNAQGASIPTATGMGAPRWLLASVGAAVGFGVLIPAMRRLTDAFGTIGSIGVVYAADIVIGLPLALAARVGLGPPSGRAWVPVVLAGLFEAAGFFCITLGATRAPLAIVSPLASLAAAITVLYAWVVLGERPARGVLIGATLVCAGVVILAI